MHDSMALRLRELRRAAGEPSYARIAHQVAELRTARGVPSEAALPPRSTVYDAFKLGRRRLDPELVSDLIAVLETAADHDRTHVTAEPDSAPTRAPGLEPQQEIPQQVDLDAEAQQTPGEGPTWRAKTLLLMLCFAVNMVGLTLIDGLDIPLWLDMIGTAIAAIALGPWWGVGVGLGSSLLDGWLTGEVAYWFAPVTAIGALVWGYGARLCAMARTTRRFFVLNVWVAFASTALAAPITYLRFDGATHHQSDTATALLAEHLPSLVLAVFAANLLYSLFDKLISGFIALAVLESLGPQWREVHRLLGRGDG